MEINNIVNFSNTGKVPQTQQLKLDDNKSFEKLVRSFQVLADEKILSVEKEGETKKQINLSILNGVILDNLVKTESSIDDNLQASSEKKLYKQILTDNILSQLQLGNQEMTIKAFNLNSEDNSKDAVSNISGIKIDDKISNESLITISKLTKSIKDIWFTNEKSNDKDLEVLSKLNHDMIIIQNVITSLINESPMYKGNGDINNNITLLNGTKAISGYGNNGVYNNQAVPPKIKQSIKSALSELLINISSKYSEKNPDFIFSKEKVNKIIQELLNDNSIDETVDKSAFKIMWGLIEKEPSYMDIANLSQANTEQNIQHKDLPFGEKRNISAVQTIKNQSLITKEMLKEKMNSPEVLGTPTVRKDVDFSDGGFYQTYKLVKVHETVDPQEPIEVNMTLKHSEFSDFKHDYLSNDFEINSNAVSKSDKKIKNEIVQENKVLKNILNENNEGKGKSDFNHIINNFMTGLKPLKVNEVPNKSSDIVVHSNSVANDVIKSVRYMEIQNIKELTVEVAPKELGELTIKLTVENGLMKANIVTNNENTLHLINSHLSEINQKLADQNMQIQSFSVNISNNDISYFNQNNHGNSGQQQNSPKTEYQYDNKEKDLEIESHDLSENNVNILA